MKRKPIMYQRQPKPTVEHPYGYIYIIQNKLTGKSYIGQKSCGFIVEDYWGSSDSLLKDIKSLGIDNFSREILDWACDKQELNQKERFWIECIGTFKGFGYNLSVGGDGLGSGKDHPCYDKHYNSGVDSPFFGIGVKITDDVRRKMSQAKQNSFGSNNNFYGKHHTEEWKSQFRNGGNNPMARRVYQYTATGEFVQEFECVRAVRKIFMNPDTVGNRCKGKIHGVLQTIRKPYNKHLWSYLPPVNGAIPPIEQEEYYQM